MAWWQGVAFPSLGLSGLSCVGDVSLGAVVLTSWDGKPRFTEGQWLAQYRSNEFRVKAELDVGAFLLLISSSAWPRFLPRGNSVPQLMIWSPSLPVAGPQFFCQVKDFNSDSLGPFGQPPQLLNPCRIYLFSHMIVHSAFHLLIHLLMPF